MTSMTLSDFFDFRADGSVWVVDYRWFDEPDSKVFWRKCGWIEGVVSSAAVESAMEYSTEENGARTCDWIQERCKEYGIEVKG